MIAAEDIIGIQYYNIIEGSKKIDGDYLGYDGICQLREYTMKWVTVDTPLGAIHIGNTALEGIPITEEWLMVRFGWERIEVEEQPMYRSSQGTAVELYDDKILVYINGGGVLKYDKNHFFIHNLQKLYWEIHNLPLKSLTAIVF